MILLLLHCGIGFSMEDPESAVNYYRQYLDDPKVLVTVAAHRPEVPVTLSEDLEYFRRHLDDIPVVVE